VHRVEARLNDLGYDQKSVLEQLENAWLNLGDTSRILTPNLWDYRTPEDVENPVEFMLNLYRQPQHFDMTCRHLLNKQLHPFQHVILRELWTKAFPMVVASRGASKSFSMAVYIVLRSLLCQGSKVVIVGASFRTAKVIFEYVEDIWYNAPVLRDICSGSSKNGPRREVDRCHCRIGESYISALPLGTGEKIRGQRANILIADEFACLEGDTLVETDIGLVRIGGCEDKLGTFLVRRSDGRFVAPDRYIRTPPTEAYRVTTRMGYEFVCSGIHKVKTTKGWKLAKELTSEDYLVHQASDYFPDGEVVEDGLEVSSDVGWLLGTLVSEGGVAGRYVVGVHTTDIETAKRTKSVLETFSKNKVSIDTRNGYIDKRGWLCKQSYTARVCDVGLRGRLEALGLSRVRASDKVVPDCILRSPRRVVLAFLSGLFDGDGTAFLWKSRGKNNHLGVAYYTASGRLAKDVQLLLHKLGVVCSRTSRRSRLSTHPQWMLRVNGEDAHRLAGMLNIPRWRGVVASACQPHAGGPCWCADRKRWRAYTYADGRVKNAGCYQSESEAGEQAIAPHLRVKGVERLDGLHTLYDFHVPDGHEFLAASFVQHNSIPVEIFENVVSGFAAVAMSPIDKVKQRAAQRVKVMLGLAEDAGEVPLVPGMNSNQTVLAGTAYYAFNHFYSYWKRYCDIINSRGDRQKLEEIFGGEVPAKFDWRAFSVVRLPVEMLPEDYMDEAHVAKQKATLTKHQYGLEYAAIWATDSDGFFRRSLVESCVVGKPESPIVLPDVGEVAFSARVRGDPNRKHVIGVDPASEQDNFSVVVVELWPNHRRVVYCWATTRRRHKTRVRKGLAKEQDFYGYAAGKIRELIQLFPCELVLMDGQGGGVAVMEALADSSRAEGGVPILPTIDHDKPKDTDAMPGLHIIEIVQFARSDWVSEANHGLRFDMESKALLFPQMNSAEIGAAIEEDKIAGRVVPSEYGEEDRLYDTLEDCALEIEDLKDELATIVHTQVGVTMRDRWDVPGSAQGGGRKNRLRKDRYSALLMANMGARQSARATLSPRLEVYGGFVRDLVKGRPAWGGGGHHQNPPWYEAATRERGYGVAVRRGNSH
jgi:intein/homing endonuclease